MVFNYRLKAICIYFKKIFNPAVIFGQNTLIAAMEAIINGTKELQNLDLDTIRYLISDSIQDITIPTGEMFENSDNYTILKKLADMGNCIFFEKLINGIPTIVICPFTKVASQDFGSRDWRVTNENLFERTKSFTGDGVANSLTISSGEEYLFIYPGTKPAYLPARVETQQYISPNLIELNNKIQSGIAIYEAKPIVGGVEKTLFDLGKQILDAQYINYTSATYKFPGVQKVSGQNFIGMPGDQFHSEYGDGLISKVTFEFSNLEFWETYEITPRVGY